jgi:hypothetical protein
MEHKNSNRHAQPSQRPLSCTKPAIDTHIPASSLKVSQSSLSCSKHLDARSPASKRTCDQTLAKTLRQQEAAENRVLQTDKKNKIPTVQQKKVE